MSSYRQLQEAECWRVSGIKSAEAFFLAVSTLLPEATHMYLEGSPSDEILALLAPHSEQIEYAAPVGTLWSWPQKERRFTLKPTPSLFADLAGAAGRHAEPEICTHLHFYRADEPLANWFDAFLDPFLVSKAIPRERVDAFASVAGGNVSEASE